MATMRTIDRRVRLLAELANIRTGLFLSWRAVWEAVCILWLAASITLVVAGIGAVLVPPALMSTRSGARLQRRLAIKNGVAVEENYRALGHGSGFAASWKRTFSMAADPETWRDLLWHVTNPFVGLFLAFLPTFGIAHGLWGLVIPWLWTPVISQWGGAWYAFIPLQNFATVWLAVALAIIELAVSLIIAGPLLRAHYRWVRFMLGRSTLDSLQARVDQLSESRADTISHQAAEIQRIERDLHDGAQTKLVAMGMTLTAATRLMDDHPAAAKALVYEARETSTSALSELRNIVRGIHPPVLSDRGLVDALRALALEAPVPTAFSVGPGLDGRALLPIESAVYFSVSELIANAAKHANANSAVVRVEHNGRTLSVTVSDDGRGGAQPKPGSGLFGIQRRLASFDGTLEIISPIGGPTSIVVSVQCALGLESEALRRAKS